MDFLVLVQGNALVFHIIVQKLILCELQKLLIFFPLSR